MSKPDESFSGTCPTCHQSFIDKEKLQTLIDLAQQEWDRGGYCDREDWPELYDAMKILGRIVYPKSNYPDEDEEE